jgi:hypothetical protein
MEFSLPKHTLDKLEAGAVIELLIDYGIPGNRNRTTG